MTQLMARHLRQGSLQLGKDFVQQIATSLQLEPTDLTAPLTDDQKREWHFYRASAREVTEVWRRVAEATTAHSYSQRQLKKLLGISQSAISRAITGERKSPVLNWHDAAKIAEALNLDTGAETFLPRDFAQEKTRERG
ncbi:helix-turn-helix domain-containing protein [Hyphomicrobium sp. DY-1]|uniref:helix-turn-helix domain-containing protein n=1 Tax=Hyphomicrobium sp. DY-1 TaxID=3075650 RepID=UPI0039C0EA91